MPNDPLVQIRESVDFLKERIGPTPVVGLILGTGLSGLSDHIQNAKRIPYADIPHFPRSTVPSHRGELIAGWIHDIPVLAMAGRFHFYEGYSMQEVTFPVRVMKGLGVEHLVVSNASGGASDRVSAGDIAVIVDHISLFPDNPLRGPNLDELGPRFPDLVDAYDPESIRMAHELAIEAGIGLKDAIYVGVPGPNLETRAEFRFFKTIGADVVGMSTIPEVIVARHMNMKVTGFTVVTNEGGRPDREPATVEEVVEAASNAAPQLEKLVGMLLKRMYPV